MSGAFQLLSSGNTSPLVIPGWVALESLPAEILRLIHGFRTREAKLKRNTEFRCRNKFLDLPPQNVKCKSICFLLLLLPNFCQTCAARRRLLGDAPFPCGLQSCLCLVTGIALQWLNWQTGIKGHCSIFLFCFRNASKRSTYYEIAMEILRSYIMLIFNTWI